MLDGARVLIAEDELLVAADLADHLEGFGAKVVGPAETVLQAAHLAATERLDAALLDFNLLDGNIAALLDILSARGIPTVLYTGSNVPEDLISRHPHVTAIPKPAPMHRIVGEIAEARERAQLATPMEGARPARTATR
jgi:DNA-binding NtrC family response regulator